MRLVITLLCSPATIPRLTLKTLRRPRQTLRDSRSLFTCARGRRIVSACARSRCSPCSTLRRVQGQWIGQRPGCSGSTGQCNDVVIQVCQKAVSCSPSGKVVFVIGADADAGINSFPFSVNGGEPNCEHLVGTGCNGTHAAAFTANCAGVSGFQCGPRLVDRERSHGFPPPAGTVCSGRATVFRAGWRLVSAVGVVVQNDSWCTRSAMATRKLEADYLVVGCGAAGMAFTDALIDACDAEVVMVDRRHAPGGHWLEAYPFVRLHQPAAFYGVNSLPLGSETIDRDGPNAGMYERTGAAEICGYYDRVMRQRLLPSGRVRWFPMSRWLGGNRFVSCLSGEEIEVTVRKKLVDARYLEGRFPASSPPPFEVAAGVRCVPIGALVDVRERPAGYVVVGAGKTALDTCGWLLDSGVPPSDIRWMKPREGWFAGRRFFQGGELVGTMLEGLSLQLESAAQATSADDLFARLETSEQLLRVDTSVAPTMFRGPTLSTAEVEQLRPRSRTSFGSARCGASSARSHHPRRWHQCRAKAPTTSTSTAPLRVSTPRPKFRSSRPIVSRYSRSASGSCRSRRPSSRATSRRRATISPSRTGSARQAASRTCHSTGRTPWWSACAPRTAGQRSPTSPTGWSARG